MVSAYWRPCDFLGEDIHSKEGKADRIDDAALALPILSEDVVLPGGKFELGKVEGSKIIEP